MVQHLLDFISRRLRAWLCRREPCAVFPSPVQQNKQKAILECARAPDFGFEFSFRRVVVRVAGGVGQRQVDFRPFDPAGSIYKESLKPVTTTQ